MDGQPRHLVLGIKQPFPQRCFECRELFHRDDDITMLPVVCEGDILSVGRWPELSGDYATENYGGRVLWARWLHPWCAGDVEAEPAQMRLARLSAERYLNRYATASARQRAIERARARRRIER